MVHLSKVAHGQALERGTLTPAERYEFNHLPMRRVDGIPVFDATRMRPDQIIETEARLETIAGRSPDGTVKDAVSFCLVASGRHGMRVKDVMQELSASKPIVLKYLRELIEAGKADVREEQHSRSVGAGSLRKRYFWIGDETPQDLDHAPELSEAVSGLQDGGMPTRHGVAVDALTCPCGACRAAVEDAMVSEERSAALRRGETGLSAGLVLRRVRRERQLAADKALAVAHGLAAS
jgi:hypothetical protein